jgi:hypothetical protein
METITYYNGSPTMTLAASNSTISQYKVCSPLNHWGIGIIDEPKQEPVKETAMSIEQSQIDYLIVRARNVKSNLDYKLWDQFNMYADNTPKTYKELIDAIKGGKYKLNEKRTKQIDARIAADADEEFDDDRFYFNGPFDGIIFDGPRPDRKGRDAASDELGKAFTKTMDAIKVLPATEGLKALQEFENWVPSNLPKN